MFKKRKVDSDSDNFCDSDANDEQANNTSDEEFEKQFLNSPKKGKPGEAVEEVI